MNWVDVPGMSLTMTVPSSQKATFLATFSAETHPEPNPCFVRMLINGAQMPPGQVMYASLTDGWTSNSNQFLAIADETQRLHRQQQPLPVDF